MFVMCECNSRSVMFIITHQNAPKCASSSTWPPPLKNLNSPLILLDDDWHWAIWCSLNNQRKVSVAQFWRIARCNRHPSGVFSYGNSSITLKMMERSGTFLPGEIYRDLGYVSELFWVVFCLLSTKLCPNKSVPHCFSFCLDPLIVRLTH